MTISTNLDLTVLNEVDGSPNFNRDYSGWTCKRSFICGWDAVFALGVLPEKNDIIDGPEDSTLYFKNISIARDKSLARVVITYSYTPSLSLGGIQERIDGKPEYSIDDGTLEKPIEDHPNYKTKWNYALLAKEGTFQSPSWWLEATTTQINEADAKVYKWQKEDQSIPEGWYKLIPAEDPRQENYLVPAPVINETTYFSTLDRLINFGKFETAVKRTPDTPFASKLGGEYLITSLNIRFDGEWWALNRSYTRADSWDSDVYGK